MISNFKLFQYSNISQNFVQNVQKQKKPLCPELTNYRQHSYPTHFEICCVLFSELSLGQTGMLSEGGKLHPNGNADPADMESTARDHVLFIVYPLEGSTTWGSNSGTVRKAMAMQNSPAEKCCSTLKGKSVTS